MLKRKIIAGLLGICLVASITLPSMAAKDVKLNPVQQNKLQSAIGLDYYEKSEVKCTNLLQGVCGDIKDQTKCGQVKQWKRGNCVNACKWQPYANGGGWCRSAGF